MVGSKNDRSNTSARSSKPQQKQEMSPSKTIKDLRNLIKDRLIEGSDGGQPANRRGCQNMLGGAQNRSKPVGRPVGFRTMNDVEFQMYQRSLFQGGGKD